jgi:predicted peptidase
MKSRILPRSLALAAVFFVMNANAQNSASITPATLDWNLHRSGELKYLLYLPADYKDAGDKRWPLMLFLHGAGERGSDVQRVAIHGPLSLVKQGTNFPFIIVAPQCPPGQIWENEPLLQLLQSVEQKYRVDEKRIYLTGLSMGGYGTWKLGLAQPGKFAAIAPICGGCNMIDVLLGPGDKGGAFKSLPVWAFHGAKDDVVPLSESERVVEGLRKGGVREVKFTVYPEARHDSWKEAYKTPELYEWMLSKSR